MASQKNNRPDTTLSESQHMRLPELLAPAGQPASLQAAIENGADAVYLGGAAFSARNRAENFSRDTLRQAIDQAHLHSVKVHLALNTLIADAQGSQALELAWQAACDGIDALIIQDIGLASQLRKNLPEVPLHASTQMTIGDEKSLDFLAALGFQRVILPRELSLAQIDDMTKLARERGLETEVFIHGALCCGYSGQCFLSHLQGGRSGNRGDCAQPCRLAYRMRQMDGSPLSPSFMPDASLPSTGRRHNKTGQQPQTAASQVRSTQSQANSNIDNDTDNKPCFPWLSPRDQALWQHLPDLIRTGVHSLKIEGRMKDAAYVGTVTGLYRDLLDGRLPVETEPQQEAIRQKLLLAFNRGGHFTDRHLTGNRRQSLHAGPVSGSFGLQLGTIRELGQISGELTIGLNEKPAPVNLPSRGDVLVIRRDTQPEAIASAPIGKIKKIDKTTLTVSGFHPRTLRLLSPGDQVFQVTDTARNPVLTSQAGDPDQARDADSSIQSQTGKTCVAVKISRLAESCSDGFVEAGMRQVSGSQEDSKQTDTKTPARVKLKITVMKGPYKNLFAETSVLAEAVTPLLPARLETQLRKTGQTPFAASTVCQQGGICLKISTVNQLRRDTLAALSEQILKSSQRAYGDQPPVWPNQSRSAENSRTVASGHETEQNTSDAQPRGQAGQPELVAYFYRLPDTFSNLACGADRYVFPLLSLNPETAAAISGALKQEEPGSSCWAFIPAIANQVQEAQLDQKKRQLSSWGFEGLYSGRPGLVFDDLKQDGLKQNGQNQVGQKQEGQNQPTSDQPISDQQTKGGGKHLEKALDWGAHLYNLEALRTFQAMGLRHMAPSTEITPRQARQIIDAAGPGLNLEWLFYGHLRAMSIAICPIGEQHPDCRRCYTAQTQSQPDQAALFSLTPEGRTRRQKRQTFDDASLRLQPHPLGCSCDIYSRQIFTADQESLRSFVKWSQGHPDSRVSLRLTFLDETAADRAALVKALRQAIQDQKQDMRLFWQAARQASETSGSPMEIKTMLQD